MSDELVNRREREDALDAEAFLIRESAKDSVRKIILKCLDELLDGLEEIKEDIFFLDEKDAIENYHAALDALEGLSTVIE